MPIDFPTAFIFCAGKYSGGDKPHPYLADETSFVVAGFIPASSLRAIGSNLQSVAPYPPALKVFSTTT